MLLCKNEWNDIISYSAPSKNFSKHYFSHEKLIIVELFDKEHLKWVSVTCQRFT